MDISLAFSFTVVGYTNTYIKMTISRPRKLTLIGVFNYV